MLPCVTLCLLITSWDWKDFITHVLIFYSFNKHTDIVEFDPNIYWTLPHWCVYVGYTLCFLLSTFSIIMVLAYGQQFGREIAWKWVKSLLFGFLEDVFFVYPVLVSFFISFWISSHSVSPVSTQRRFNVVTTLLTSKQRCINVKTTSRAYIGLTL